MGGCATKPKVTKDDADVKLMAPEPEPEPEHEEVKEDTAGVETKPQEQADLNIVNEIVDDDQGNKRRSLSLLFKESEDIKVSTEKENTTEEEAVKPEKVEEAEKPSEDTESKETIVKQESPIAVEKLSVESKDSEPAKQETAVVENFEVKEKSLALENQSSATNPIVEETVKTKTPEVEKKPTEETKINELPAEGKGLLPESEAEKKPSEETKISEIPAEKTVKPSSSEAEKKPSESEAEKKPSKETQINELPVEKTEKPSEVNNSEPLKEETKNNREVVPPQPEEKIIEVVPTNKVAEKKTEEATSSVEGKSQVGVEDSSKVAVAVVGSEIH